MSPASRAADFTDFTDFPVRAGLAGRSGRARSPTRVMFAAVFLLVVPSGGGSVARAAEKLRFKSVADFARCVDDYQAAPETCLDVLDAYVKAAPGQAFAAGKAVRAGLNHAAAVPFFAKALASAGGAAGKSDQDRCADKDVALALIAGLGLPAGRGTLVADAFRILDRCWSETQAPVLKALGDAGPSGFMAQNLCPKLSERRVSSPACEKKAAPVVAPAAKWKDLDPRAMTPDGPSKVFAGSEGRRVTLVKLQGEDAYLIKFEGFRGAWNGRVVLHRATPTTDGYDYFTQAGGSRWVTVVMRDGFTEVYPAGDKGPFTVAYDEAASRAPGSSGQAVLEQFRKQKP